MKFTKNHAALLLALAFSWLFFYADMGVNVLIFDVFATGAIAYFLPEKLKVTSVKLFLAGMLISGFFVMWHNTSWSIFMHNTTLWLLGGALAASHLRSLYLAPFVGFANFGLSVQNWLGHFKTPQNPKAIRAHAVWRKARIAIIPLVAVVIFSSMYAGSSPWFQTHWHNFLDFLGSIFGDFFEMLSFRWIFVFLLGLFFAVYLLFGKPSHTFEEIDAHADDVLIREREKYRGKTLGLKREYQGAVLMFVLLNMLLLAQNALDFAHVWIGFTWDGAYLKQFVHEGTYLLIFSILLSAAVVLFYFRGNINFYKNNKVLRFLAAVWLFQNMFLAASVAVRNIWYIQYFNLAYKRIGVFFFLVAVIYGLFTVYQKIKNQKSLHFLLRTNALVVYVLMLSIGFVNWDVVIAKTNFSRSGKAYVHFGFLQHLDASALPYISEKTDQLALAQLWQNQVYGEDKSEISAQQFTDRMVWRKDAFFQNYPKRNWQAWNFADWNAYQKLKQNK